MNQAWRQLIPGISLAGLAMLGLGLIIVPFAFDLIHLRATIWLDAVAGSAIAVLALAQMRTGRADDRLGWAVALFGMAIMAGPFVLGFADDMLATALHLAIGAGVLALALISMLLATPERQKEERT